MKSTVLLNIICYLLFVICYLFTSVQPRCPKRENWIGKLFKWFKILHWLLVYFRFCLLVAASCFIPNGHNFCTRHSLHFGRWGKQCTCPKPTSRGLTSGHSSAGNSSCNCYAKKSNLNQDSLKSLTFLVSSGVWQFRVHPSRSLIRWTCTSTPIPSFRPQAHCSAK